MQLYHALLLRGGLRTRPEHHTPLWPQVVVRADVAHGLHRVWRSPDDVVHASCVYGEVEPLCVEPGAPWLRPLLSTYRHDQRRRNSDEEHVYYPLRVRAGEW